MKLEAVSYPNPFANQLYIKGIKPNQTISIVDVMGRIYYESQSSNTSELGINATQWPSGVYIVIVRGENETKNETIKIIKE